MKYLIVIEETATSYSAYAPDVPGCIATGRARDEVEREMKAAIALHVDGLKAEGLAIPRPIDRGLKAPRLVTAYPGKE